MKLSLKGSIKDITNDEISSFNLKGLKVKNKISYILDNEKYTLLINAPNRLILNRETEEINSTIYFELNTIKPSIYYLKRQNMNLEINIKTDSIIIEDNLIDIKYTVIDSDTKYEYKIEMSEQI